MLLNRILRQTIQRRYLLLDKTASIIMIPETLQNLPLCVCRLVILHIILAGQNSPMANQPYSVAEGSADM
jgi:hypothetical protein